LSAIFISYRREDAEDSARALYESLVPEFGKDRLFMDVEAIALGSDFRQAVDHSLSNCGVFLAIIGPTWVSIKADNDPSGARRLDNPGDVVRQEVGTALKKGASLPVIPVLVRGATMPTADQLPDDLKDLAFRNALTLNHLDWDGNLQKLANAIRPHVGGPPAQQKPAGLTGTGDGTSSVSTGTGSGGSPRKAMLVGGAAAVILVAAVLYFVIKPNQKTEPTPTPEGTLAVTLVKNPRLTDLQGPVDVSIDDHLIGQIRSDASGSTPLKFQVAAGEHHFQFADPQTHASCTGTFSVNANQVKFIPRMRAGGTACAMDAAL
jgi:TIR domain